MSYYDHYFEDYQYPPEQDPDGTFGYFTETEPFAKGALRLAYKGKTTRKIRNLQKGQNLVIKSWIKGHAMDLGSWDDHLKCEHKLQELAAIWNRMKVSPLVYEAVISIEGRSLNAVGSGLVRKDEWVLVEPYLKGEWTKWNSNTGTHSKHRDACVQAFSHWTYHHTRGNLLFCDAQGVIKGGKRLLLSDPCIVSRKPKQYGITDGGVLMQAKWFSDHRCNEYCQRGWLWPRREDRAVAAQIVAYQQGSTYVQSMKADLMTCLPTIKEMNLNHFILDQIEEVLEEEVEVSDGENYYGY